MRRLIFDFSAIVAHRKTLALMTVASIVASFPFADLPAPNGYPELHPVAAAVFPAPGLVPGGTVYRANGVSRALHVVAETTADEPTLHASGLFHMRVVGGVWITRGLAFFPTGLPWRIGERLAVFGQDRVSVTGGKG